MKNSFLLLALLFLMSCSAPRVIKLQSLTKPIDDHGLVFTLPKTMLKIEVFVRKTMHHKGPFAEFADKYFGLQNVIKSEQTSFSIDNVKITSYKEADSTQLYFISHLPHHFKIDFDENGLLNSINACPQPPRPYFTGRTFQDENPYHHSNLFRNYAENNLVEKIDTITEEVHADSASYLKQTLKKTMVEKPMMLRVEEAADYILKVRQNRLNILSATNEVAYEKASIEYMANELLKIENDYMTLFTGITDEQNIICTYYIEPVANQDTYPLFVFSNTEGVVKNAGDKAFSVVLQINSDKIYAKIPDNFSVKHFQNGFPYRLAEISEIIVKTPSTILTTEKLPILQRGIVYRIPLGNHTRISSYPNGNLQLFHY
ncbi:MAG: DUF4831 family protein [Bacteroidota bacterium]